MPITQTLTDESEEMEIKSVAARCLGSGRCTNKEGLRFAAYVLGDGDPERTTAHQHRIDIPGDNK